MRRLSNLTVACLLAAGCVHPGTGDGDDTTGDPSDPTDPTDPQDPIEPAFADQAGDYQLTSTVDLTVDALLPEQVRGPVVLVQDFRSQPAATLIRMLDEAGVPLVSDLYAVLPGALESKIEGWIDGYVDGLPGVTELDRILALTQVVVTRFEIDSQLAIEAPDADGRAAARHSLESLRYRIDADTAITVSLADLPAAQRQATIAAQLSAAAGADAAVVLSDHGFGIPYGEYAYQALEQMIAAEYGTDLRGALGEIVDCPALAAHVADRCVLSVCVGHEQELAAICEAGLDALAAEVHDQLAAYRIDALRLHRGDAAIRGTAIAGSWDAAIDFGQGPRPVPAMFAGARAE